MIKLKPLMGTSLGCMLYEWPVLCSPPWPKRLKTEREEYADRLWSHQDEPAHPRTRWVPAVSTSCTALPLSL